MNRGLVLTSFMGLVAIGLLLGQRGADRISPSRDDAPPVAQGPLERKVLETIALAVKSGDLYANVPAADGRLLRILTESINAKQVVEIGTSTGISGLWLSLGLDKTGGKLTTLELDKARAAVARKHFKMAGVDSRITLIEGDAHKNLSRVQGPVDLVFIDAEKEGYIDYLNQILPSVRPGGLILAHNTNMVAEYMKRVTTSPDLETVVYANGGGMAVTLKKR